MIHHVPLDVWSIIMEKLTMCDIDHLCRVCKTLDATCKLTHPYESFCAIIKQLPVSKQRQTMKRCKNMTIHKAFNIISYLLAHASDFQVLQQVPKEYVDANVSIILANKKAWTVLQHFHSMGYSISADPIGIIAANQCNIPMLQWALQHGCKEHEIIRTIAKHQNQPEIALCLKDGSFLTY